MPSYQGFGTVTTTSRFIEHEKTVAKEKQKEAVGDAVIDGGSIKWKYFPRFHDKSDQEIEKMTLKDYEKHEDERNERNAWRVANEKALCIDDAPVLSDYIRAFVTEKDMEALFFNRSQLRDFIKAPDNSKSNVPGYNYFVKISDYISDHYDIGELYMEFIKDACIVKKGRKCVSCGIGWLGSVMDTGFRTLSQISRPPDIKVFLNLLYVWMESLDQWTTICQGRKLKNISQKESWQQQKRKMNCL